LLLENTDDLDIVARRFFGKSPSGDWATHKAFITKLGVDLKPFAGYYMEIGGTPAPIAPITAGIVKPILALKQTHTGRCTPMRHSVEGLYSQDRKRAWVDVDVWETMLGDDFFDRILHEAKAIDGKQ
jgi:hypothetical protein